MKKEFLGTALILGDEVFVIYIVVFSSDSGVNPSYKAQVALFKADKALTSILFEYADIINVFALKLVAKLSKYTRINNYTIKLVDDQQLLYEPIHSLGLIKLEILKTYIKTYLANSFIQPSQSLVDIPIIFVKKTNSSLL